MPYLKASFNSGVGGGDAGETSTLSFELSKILAISLNIRKKFRKFGHLCSHCVMNATDCRICLILTFFFSIINLKTFLCNFRKKP